MIKARTCTGCGKTHGVDMCMPKSSPFAGYWHLRCLLRARSKKRKPNA